MKEGSSNLSIDLGAIPQREEASPPRHIAPYDRHFPRGQMAENIVSRC
jgi:hypothetical protein